MGKTLEMAEVIFAGRDAKEKVCGWVGTCQMNVTFTQGKQPSKGVCARQGGSAVLAALC